MATAMETAGAAQEAAAAADPLVEQLDEAHALKSANPARAAELYRAVALGDNRVDPEAIKVKEAAVEGLCAAYVTLGRADALRALLTDLRPLFATIPKAKTAKIVRQVLDSVGGVPGAGDLQIELCRETVAWATAEKRTFLRQRIELRLAALSLSSQEFNAALALVSTLLSEVKRLDDKLLLVDIHLLESRVHHALRNLPKAKAALTAARTAANAIYVPPVVQSAIDMQSGTLHAEEKDYKTAYSYFFEAMEQLCALGDDTSAAKALKYMLLCKVMLSHAEDVPGLIAAKGGLKLAGPQLESMRAVAAAHAGRSLSAFEAALRSYPKELGQDPIVDAHLSALYDALLEQNLCRLVEPFSVVEVAHVAGLIGLPVATVEAKLAQLILDKRFAGTLDQGAGCLVVFDAPAGDALYDGALATIANMGKVVDGLVTRSQRIFTH